MHKNKFTIQNKVRLVQGGSVYFSLLLQLIAGAKESIHLQTYIYENDDTGLLIARALKEAVLRNVQVHLMVDGYASQALPDSFIKELKDAGIHFRFFEPVFKSSRFYFGRRMHHKVVVADAKVAMVGGVNISNRYNDRPGHPAWLDFALHAEGEVAKELCVLCWKSWKGYPMNMGITPCEEKILPFDFSPEERSEVRMRRNDWVRRKNQISSTYVQLLRTSEKEVTILCSYFLPGVFIRRQMLAAIKRGVSIRVIAAGKSDVKVAKSAERWLYDWLLRNGIQLFEYRQNILHGKLAVCDEQWMTLGSYNINNISAYASIELNLDVRNPAFVKSVRQTLEEIIEKDCDRISFEKHKRTKNVFKQFSRWLSYQFIRTVFYLFTFYFKHNI
ncbi:MAG TPA: phospholipase D-like domain-containing protein [Ferruginibacter sp.]|nr:phospholipase [Chitinophagaceae bacterium]HRI23786.1 phospholipase D-like domain-containing protein [Ferruginibacter sp.]